MAQARFDVTYNGVGLAGRLTFLEALETARKLRASHEQRISLYLFDLEGILRWSLTLDRYTPSLHWLGDESPLTPEEVEGLAALLEGGQVREITTVAIGLLARDLARTGDPAIAAAILKVTGEGSLWAEWES